MNFFTHWSVVNIQRLAQVTLGLVLTSVMAACSDQRQTSAPVATQAAATMPTQAASGRGSPSPIVDPASAGQAASPTASRPTALPSPMDGMSPSAGSRESVQTKSTDHYRFTLRLGLVEMMMSEDEAKEMNAKAGELMVGPSMSGMMTEMDQRGNKLNHHLDIEVQDAKSGEVLKGRNLKISVTKEGSKDAQNVRAMPMYDMQQGERDYHYGDNVYLPAGQYTVRVALGDDSVEFLLTLI